MTINNKIFSKTITFEQVNEKQLFIIGDKNTSTDLYMKINPIVDENDYKYNAFSFTDGEIVDFESWAEVHLVNVEINFS